MSIRAIPDSNYRPHTRLLYPLGTRRLTQAEEPGRRRRPFLIFLGFAVVGCQGCPSRRGRASPFRGRPTFHNRSPSSSAQGVRCGAQCTRIARGTRASRRSWRDPSRAGSALGARGARSLSRIAVLGSYARGFTRASRTPTSRSRTCLLDPCAPCWTSSSPARPTPGVA